MKEAYAEKTGLDTCGAQALCFGIIEQAVTDYNSLVDNGIIRSGKCFYDSWFINTGIEGRNKCKIETNWPKRLKVVGYKNPAEVKYLIWFFEGGVCEKMLVLCGASISIGSILSKLGLKEKGE